MPIYEYKCADCGAHVEKMQKVSDAPLTVCENCGGKMEKQWSLSGFQFKGSGWYLSDYSNKLKDPNAAKTDKAEKSDKTDKTEKSEKTSAESTAKPETASNKANDAASGAKKENAAKKD